MNIHGIVAVSGKPGLWKALTQTKTGFVLESLDSSKTKLVVNTATAKLAALEEITIFGNDDDIKLIDIFGKMKSEGNVPDAKADGKVLRQYFYGVAPDHDESRVYTSDIKKVVSWYSILKDQPGFNEEAEKPVSETPAEPASENKPAVKAKAEPKSKTEPKAKKASAK